MIISIKRIVKSGWSSFFRNIALSMASVFIMVIVISFVTFLFFLNPISNTLIADVEEKVDVSVYFTREALEQDIFEVKSELSKIEQVKEIEYISQEDAFNFFMERHKDDPVLIESLIEVGYNPFLASLSIKAREPSEYEQITVFLEKGSFGEVINEIDYHQRKPIIDRIFALTSGIRGTGIIFSIIFGLIAILIAFNTIRIAIHNSNKEISVMRLVGASNKFVRGPFLVQGIIVGFFSALIALFLTFLVSWGINGKINALIPNISTLQIFLGNFFLLFSIQLATGIGLGMVSSYIAIRKYLKI